MKVKQLLIVFFFLIILCGCSKKEESLENYEHYDLSDKDIITYKYYKDKNEIPYDDSNADIYVLSDLTPENYDFMITGLFYKVSGNDYILLEKLESSSDLQYQFVDNKLYGQGIDGTTTPALFVVELDGKETNIKEIELKMNDQRVAPFSFYKVEEDIMYISTLVFENEHSTIKGLKCSLSSFECEINETN